MAIPKGVYCHDLLFIYEKTSGVFKIQIRISVHLCACYFLLCIIVITVCYLYAARKNNNCKQSLDRYDTNESMIFLWELNESTTKA